MKCAQGVCAPFKSSLGANTFLTVISTSFFAFLYWGSNSISYISGWLQSLFVAKDDFDPLALLPPSPRCWEYSCDRWTQSSVHPGQSLCHWAVSPPFWQTYSHETCGPYQKVSPVSSYCYQRVLAWRGWGVWNAVDILPLALYSKETSRDWEHSESCQCDLLTCFPKNTPSVPTYSKWEGSLTLWHGGPSLSALSCTE